MTALIPATRLRKRDRQAEGQREVVREGGNGGEGGMARWCAMKTR